MCNLTLSAYEFLNRFPNEETARTYIEASRWHGQPICPHCGSVGRMYSESRKGVAGYYRCSDCNQVFTVRTGTIFERSHVPLHKWLYAIYLVVTARKGISSLQLSKEIGVTQKTAWFMLQRIRAAAGNDKDGDQGGTGGLLKGIVEADEIYIGGKETNKHESKKLKAGRGAVGKVGVLGMRERNGRVRAAVISGTTAKEIQSNVRNRVAPCATLCTDEHAAYRGVPEYEVSAQ